MITLDSYILINNKNLDFVYCDHFRTDEMGFKEELIKLNNFEVLFEHGAGVMFKRRVFNKIGFLIESEIDAGLRGEIIEAGISLNWAISKQLIK